MTLHDELQLRVKCAELRKAGKPDEAMKLAMTIPMPLWLADWWIKYAGVERLKESGWNLSEVEAAYGPNWFAKKYY
jgi:hypothetical protein